MKSASLTVAAASVAIAAALFGCAAPTPDVATVDVEEQIQVQPAKTTAGRVWRIVIDEGAPAWFDAEVRRAIVDWEQNVGCPTAFSIERGDVATGGRMPPPQEVHVYVVDRFDDPGRHGEGYAWYGLGGGSQVLLLRDRTEDVACVVRHELGHAFGLEHADGAVVMNERCMSSTVTRDDADAYDARWCR